MFFLNNIWIIPLLPIFSAAVMFFFGRKLSGIPPRPRYPETHGDHGDGAHGMAHVPQHGADPHAAHDEHGHVHEIHTWVNFFCVGTVVLAFLWACLAVYQYSGYAAQHNGEPFQRVLYTWIGGGEGVHSTAVPSFKGTPVDFTADWGYLLDPLSAIWLLFVTGVGMLIHIYATGYMAHDGGYYRFFGYLNLFMFAMLTLILANNYALLFVGWEGVGLCSYLLIGFYFHKHSASTAANKAFIVNRIGDAAFLLGMFAMTWYFGSLRFTDIISQARSGQFHIGDPVIVFATLMFFIGACGKSAQLPLYVWLPDAMEGPTPVSALIHAATMVTAGVYMVARSNALFILAPESMKVVAIVGALTAIFAASIGLVQNDIKRVLAYSTISQLGYMFLALGVGAFAAGVFHVFTHAFFKALLFLCSGSVIHAMSGEQDMRFMGALRKKIPTTYWTMFAGTLAIAGIPPLAGFFSKDEILWQAYSAHNGEFKLLWGIGFVAALMTSFYMFRLMYLTFWSPSRMTPEVEAHVHESPRSMTVPLIILALGSIGAGWLGVPPALGGTNRFEAYLAPVFENRAVTEVAQGTFPATSAGAAASAQKKAETAETAPKPEGKGEHTEAIEYILMGLSVALGFGGWWLAKLAYARSERGYVEVIDGFSHPVYMTLLNKYYVDEAYDYAFTGRRPVAGDVRLGAMGLGTAMWKFDANVIDGVVNGAGWMTKAFGIASSWWDKWIIDGLCVNGSAVLARIVSFPVRMFQWGLVQWYALVMVAGVVGFVWYYLMR